MERRLAAILVADVAGFSRLAGADEEATLAGLERLRVTVVDPTIAEHGGRVFKTTGDGLLAAFPSVVEAVRCAVRIQQVLAAPREGADVDRRMALRIAVHVGDVVVSGNDLLGDGVNIAARLEQLAEPGGICISGAVHEQVRDRLPSLRFADGGEHALRNIVRPLRIWRLAPPARTSAGEHPLRSGLHIAALPQHPPAPDRPSLAILPFTNLSGDGSEDYFSDGITEEIITAVSRFQGLLVIARNASFTMRGRESDSQRVGAALGAEYLLQGSIRRAGDRIRVTAQLVEAASGTQMWGERFDRTLADVLDVQDDIAGRIVSAVAPQIRDVEIVRARQPGRTFTRSYDLALRALALCEDAWRVSDRARMRDALDVAREAASTEPVSPRAFDALAFISLQLSDLAYFAADAMPRALEEAQAAAERLAEMDPDNHVTYLRLGHIAMQQHRGDDARRLLRRSLDLNPNDPMAARMLSWAESNDGLAADAIAHAHDALLRTPMGRDRPNVLWTLALAHWVGGDPAAALPYAREAVAGTATSRQLYGVLVACLAELGEIDEARALLAEAEAVAPGYVKSRLEGKTWFTRQDLAARYTSALRKAAGLA
ncbi:MAG TPA: adenylate/guanylate cyclase domain-containing protein [Casimicrobiaceae bacterium]|jgi:adenylate cyclase|nr:adenylate/guanylate cyclase domain-containing protein [Casimicrobiaceae bacterium]